MISNNSSHKLKASKSSDCQDNNLDDSVELESIDGEAIGDSNRRYQGSNYFDGRNRGAKPRRGEYKPNRNMERRGYRGRGNMASRRTDRDFSDGGVYIISRKYQDSLSKNTGMYHQSKFYESDKKVEIKFNLPEDTRISKLLED
ncbi:hypothetical protein MML48_1g07827 [Holotrichia oblita]|uniref:Uncharacterized protein n=1 Tax=Holotrichia oblita TaxID=644536 RepID=A0ACB9TW66_HOLOL|nr:hypothetical protein MML48_1g07827 [Holotrichia oblita]